MTLTPIGFWAGTCVDGNGLTGFQVRVGMELIRLEPLDFLLWRVAAGDPETVLLDGWGREETLQGAREALATDGAANPAITSEVLEAAYQRLREAGLLLDINRLADVSGLRMRRLGQALGAVADEPDREILGVGGQAVAVMSDVAVGLLRLADLCDSFTEAAEALAGGEELLEEETEALRAAGFRVVFPTARVAQAYGMAYFDRIPNRQNPISYLTGG